MFTKVQDVHHVSTCSLETYGHPMCFRCSICRAPFRPPPLAPQIRKPLPYRTVAPRSPSPLSPLHPFERFLLNGSGCRYFSSSDRFRKSRLANGGAQRFAEERAYFWMGDADLRLQVPFSERPATFQLRSSAHARCRGSVVACRRDYGRE